MSLPRNEFVGLNGWRIGEIEKGIEEANRNEFATDKEVEEFMKRWIDAKR